MCHKYTIQKSAQNWAQLKSSIPSMASSVIPNVAYLHMLHIVLGNFLSLWYHIWENQLKGVKFYFGSRFGFRGVGPWSADSFAVDLRWDRTHHAVEGQGRANLLAQGQLGIRERERKRPGTRYTLQGHTTSDTPPPTSPHLLKSLSLPNNATS